MLKILLAVIFTLISIAYPVLIYTGLKHQVLNYLIVFIAIVFFIRFCLTRKNKSAIALVGKYSLIAALSLCILSLIFNKLELVLIYPVVVNAVLFIVFFSSLFTRKPLITALAELTEKNLSDFGFKYTRALTVFWSIFFVVNGAVALYTVILNDIEIWTLYNGLISYLVIGVTFAVEFILRAILRYFYDNK